MELYFDHGFPMWISIISESLARFLFVSKCISRPFFINWCDLASPEKNKHTKISVLVEAPRSVKTRRNGIKSSRKKNFWKIPQRLPIPSHWNKFSFVRWCALIRSHFEKLWDGNDTQIHIHTRTHTQSRSFELLACLSSLPTTCIVAEKSAHKNFI